VPKNGSVSARRGSWLASSASCPHVTLSQPSVDSRAGAPVEFGVAGQYAEACSMPRR
jgi:hypothetical protein